MTPARIERALVLLCLTSCSPDWQDRELPPDEVDTSAETTSSPSDSQEDPWDVTFETDDGKLYVGDARYNVRDYELFESMHPGIEHALRDADFNAELGSYDTIVRLTGRLPHDERRIWGRTFGPESFASRSRISAGTEPFSIIINRAGELFFPHPDDSFSAELLFEGTNFTFSWKGRLRSFEDESEFFDVSGTMAGKFTFLCFVPNEHQYIHEQGKDGAVWRPWWPPELLEVEGQLHSDVCQDLFAAYYDDLTIEP